MRGNVMATHLHDPPLFNERYRRKELIGRGGFAEVYLADDLVTSRLGRKQVALKIIDKDAMEKRGVTVARAITEVTIHKKLCHPKVIELYEAFEDDKNLYLVTEYCPFGDLHTYISRNGPLPEHIASGVFEQLVRGLQYLHNANVIHRDLSTSNIFISKLATQPDTAFEVKIGDLGLATVQESKHQQHTTVCGTPNFMSPEIAGNGWHNQTADIWSLGAILFAMLAGHKLQLGRQQHIHSQLVFSSEANELLKLMLCEDQARRIALDDVKNHHFLYKASTSRPYVSQTVRNNAMSTATVDSGRGGSIRSQVPVEQSSPLLSVPHSAPNKGPVVRSVSSPARHEQQQQRRTGPLAGSDGHARAGRSHNEQCVHMAYGCNSQQQCTQCNKQRSVARAHQSPSTSRRGSEHNRVQLLPIRTDQLTAQIETTKHGRVRICKNGDVFGEYFISDTNRRVQNVMHIHSNGELVSVYKVLASENVLDESVVPPADERTLRRYSLQELQLSSDRVLRKKYLLVQRVIQLLTAKLPKVTVHRNVHHNPRVTAAVLRWNGDLQCRFVDGTIALRTAAGQVQSETTSRRLSAQQITDCESSGHLQLYLECEQWQTLVQSKSADGFPCVFGSRVRSNTSSAECASVMNVASRAQTLPLPMQPAVRDRAMHSARQQLSHAQALGHVQHNQANTSKHCKHRSSSVRSNTSRCSYNLVPQLGRVRQCTDGFELVYERNEHERLRVTIDGVVLHTTPDGRTLTYDIEQLPQHIQADVDLMSQARASANK